MERRLNALLRTVINMSWHIRILFLTFSDVLYTAYVPSKPECSPAASRRFLTLRFPTYNRLSHRIANCNPHYQGTYQVHGDFPVSRIEHLLPVGGTMARRVIRQHLTKDKRAQSRGNPHGICGGRNGSRTVFSPPPPSSTSVFPSVSFYLCSTFIHSFIHSFIHHPRYYSVVK